MAFAFNVQYPLSQFVPASDLAFIHCRKRLKADRRKTHNIITNLLGRRSSSHVGGVVTGRESVWHRHHHFPIPLSFVLLSEGFISVRIRVFRVAFFGVWEQAWANIQHAWSLNPLFQITRRQTVTSTLFTNSSAQSLQFSTFFNVKSNYFKPNQLNQLKPVIDHNVIILSRWEHCTNRSFSCIETLDYRLHLNITAVISAFGLDPLLYLLNIGTHPSANQNMPLK